MQYQVLTGWQSGKPVSFDMENIMAKSFLAKVTLLREMGAGYPDQGLPPGSPGAPDQGLPEPIYPDQGLPPSVSHPIMPLPPGSPVAPTHPISGEPGAPSYPIYIPIGPDQGLPDSGAHPDQGLPGSGAHPDQGLPGGGKPPAIWPPLPPGAPYPSGTLWLLAILPGVGWRYVRVDLGTRPDQGLPVAPAHPDQGLPPTPAPKKF
jgi:hypothetical protein